MALTSGQSLARDSLLPLGVGVMGEVSCARDTRLDREVGLEVLREEFAGDEERLRRAEREGRMHAPLGPPLDHPNAVQIHGVGVGLWVGVLC